MKRDVEEKRRKEKSIASTYGNTVTKYQTHFVSC